MIAALMSTRLDRPKSPRLALADLRTACVIRKRGWRTRHACLIERSVTFGAAVLLMSAASLWWMPGASNGADVAPLKLLASTGLLMGAVVMARRAGRGMLHETRFDFEDLAMVQVLRNCTGGETELYRAPFSALGRFSVLPDRAQSGDGHLVVEILGQRRPVLIGSDRMTALEYLCHSLNDDIRAGRRVDEAGQRKRLAAAFSARMR